MLGRAEEEQQQQQKQEKAISPAAAGGDGGCDHDVVAAKEQAAAHQALSCPAVPTSSTPPPSSLEEEREQLLRLQEEQEEVARRRREMHAQRETLAEMRAQMEAEAAEVEAQRRDLELQREAAQRQWEEELQLRQEQKGRELAQRERRLWAALAPEEGERLRHLLQAVARFQQQVAENEVLIADLQEQIAGKERACRATQRRASQAVQEAEHASDQELHHQEELGRWTRKRAHLESLGEEALDFATLGRRCDGAQAACARVREEKADLQQRSAQARRLEALRAELRLGLEAHKAAQAEELAKFVPAHAAEVAELGARHSKEAAHLQLVHGGHASELSAALEVASRRREAHRRDRDEAQGEHDTRQREGVALHQECSDARQQLLNLSTEVKEAIWRTEAASPWGDLLELAEAEGSDPEIEEYAEDLHWRCRQLQRECTRTHDALEKKHAEVDRWRSRRFFRGGEAIADGEPFMLG